MYEQAVAFVALEIAYYVMLSASLLRYAVGFERQGRAAEKSGFGQYCSLWLAARGPWLVARGSVILPALARVIR